MKVAILVLLGRLSFAQWATILGYYGSPDARGGIFGLKFSPLSGPCYGFLYTEYIFQTFFIVTVSADMIQDKTSEALRAEEKALWLVLLGKQDDLSSNLQNPHKCWMGMVVCQSFQPQKVEMGDP